MKSLEDITKHKYFTLTFSIFIFVVAFFLRAYRLTEFIGYHQDQVRDLFYIKDFLEAGKPILLGPKASVGDFFLPPFWYYLMAIVYTISHSPLAPGILVIIFSSLTSVLLFLLGKKFLNLTTGVVAASLFTISPLAIEYGRFAWNPNPIPFFTVLTLLALLYYYRTHKELYFYGAVLAANLTFQLHYQGFILVAICFGFLLLKPLKKIPAYIVSGILFIVLLLPFFIHEWTHSFENMNAIIDFLSRKSNQGKFMGINNSIKVLLIDYPQFIANVLFFGHKWVGRIAFVILHGYLAIKLFMAFKQKSLNSTVIVQLVYAASLLVLFLYRQWIIDYYLLVIVVPLILFFSLFLYDIFPKKYATIIVAIIISINLIYSPTFKEPQQMLPFFETINTTRNRGENYMSCINYLIKTPDLQFAPKAVEYIYENSPRPKTIDIDCKTQFILCETSLCPQPNGTKKTIIENESLDLRFIQLQ